MPLRRRKFRWKILLKCIIEKERRWVDNIKTDVRELGWDGMDCIDMAQDRDQWRTLVSTVLNLRVPQNSGKLFSGCTIGGSSRRAQLREKETVRV
jgi:hypothetical protein